MKLAIYQIMHVGSLLMLTSFLFMAFANPDPSGRRKTLMWTGIFSLLMLVGGFGMLSVLKLGFPAWIWVKLVCWLILSALAGMAYRKPASMLTWKALSWAALLIDVATVYLKTSFE